MVQLNIDSHIFNVVSDLLGTVIRAVLLGAIAFSYRYLMSMHLRTGKFIPIDHFGVIPKQFMDGFMFAKKSGVSLVSALLVFLLLVAELSHTFSDFGLKFVNVNLVGDEETVLDLTMRNSEFIYQVVGDPYNARTSIQSENDAELTNSFLAAADSIARGTSGFLSTPGKIEVTGMAAEAYIYGAQFFPYRAGEEENETLASIPDKIPLTCNNEDFLKRIEQVLGFDFPQMGVNDRLTFDSKVPDCDFSKTRETGISQSENHNIQTTSITEYAQHIANDDTPAMKFRFSDSSGGGDYNTFYMHKSIYRGIARDRNNWREGRNIFGITGIVHPFNDIVHLGRMVFVNAGNTLASSVMNGIIPTDPKAEYIFVAEVTGRCPPKPGKKSWETSYDESCMAFIRTLCDQFPEDYLAIPIDTYQTMPGAPDVSESSTCKLTFIEYVWGYNFGTIDYEFLTAVAGVLARNSASMRSPHGHILAINAIPSAMFLLANVSKMKSNKEEVRPEIDSLWIFCMLFPICLGAVIALLSYLSRRQHLLVPQNQWEVMVVGNEEDTSFISTRRNKSNNFPPKKDHVKYGLVKSKNAEDQRSGALVLGFSSTESSPHGFGTIEEIVAPTVTAGVSRPNAQHGAIVEQIVRPFVAEIVNNDNDNTSIYVENNTEIINDNNNNSLGAHGEVNYPPPTMPTIDDNDNAIQNKPLEP